MPNEEQAAMERAVAEMRHWRSQNASASVETQAEAVVHCMKRHKIPLALLFQFVAQTTSPKDSEEPTSPIHLRSEKTEKAKEDIMSAISVSKSEADLDRAFFAAIDKYSLSEQDLADVLCDFDSEEDPKRGYRSLAKALLFEKNAPPKEERKRRLRSEIARKLREAERGGSPIFEVGPEFTRGFSRADLEEATRQASRSLTSN